MFQDNKKKMFKIISPQKKKDGTTWWMKCGVGYENKDLSINMYLESLPLDREPGPLKLQLREFTEAELRETRERAEQRRNSGSGTSSYASRGRVGGSDGSYSSRGTLGSSRSSTFDAQLDPSHIPLIPSGMGGDSATLDQTPF